MLGKLKQPLEMPPNMVVVLVVAVVVFVIAPALKLGPLGEVELGVVASIIAFAMGRRVRASQAARRAGTIVSTQPY